MSDLVYQGRYAGEACVDSHPDATAMEMTTVILAHMEGHANTTNIQAYDHCTRTRSISSATLLPIDKNETSTLRTGGHTSCTSILTDPNTSRKKTRKPNTRALRLAALYRLGAENPIGYENNNVHDIHILQGRGALASAQADC